MNLQFVTMRLDQPTCYNSLGPFLLSFPGKKCVYYFEFSVFHRERHKKPHDFFLFYLYSVKILNKHAYVLNTKHTNIQILLLSQMIFRFSNHFEMSQKYKNWFYIKKYFINVESTHFRWCKIHVKRVKQICEKNVCNTSIENRLRATV